MQYGMYDTVDNNWLGDDTGPLTGDSLQIMTLAAAAACKKFGWPDNRAVCREFLEDPARLYKKDNIPVVMEAPQAISQVLEQHNIKVEDE